MKKKVIIISTIIAAIIVLGSCSYSITASNLERINSTETVKIEVNQYLGNPYNTIETEVNINEAEEIREILINLNKAITSNDKKAIEFYEKEINSKGIFENDYQEFYSNEEYNQILKSNKRAKLINFLGSKNGDDLSNIMCYFNAIGSGLFVSYLGALALDFFLQLMSNATSFIEMFVIFIVFFPLVALVVVLTGFIPIRILMPRGNVWMESGRISTIGLNGVKRITVDTEPVTVNLSLFTGLSISIPGNEDSGREPFVFASGLAARVQKID
jgi:outer membrane lipoprotein-sorting protein